MIEYLKLIFDYLKGKNKDEIAKISAHFLAPAVVLGLSVIGFFGGGAADLDRPIAISELRTESISNGDPAPKRGIVIISEPGSADYRIPLGPNASRVWSSLDEEAARANADRLVLKGGGLNGKSPFIGVNGPIAVVVDGDLGKDVEVLGGTEATDDWRLSSRRSGSLVSSVLGACFFAFGVSITLATARPVSEGNKRKPETSRMDMDLIG
jgi:hypothetical protein